MIGRADSVLAIRNVLCAAADSRAAALKLVGEPGIGKTTLCRLAESLALAAGFLVITAVGMEWESNLELAALTQILAPLADGLDDLAATQAQLLRSVLAAAPPADTDPFALAVAVHSCLVRAADAQPILLILDDIQWLDATSTGVLAFALRRLEADAVATVIARRPEVADPFPASWPELEVGRLCDDDVRRLLERLRPDLPSVDPGVARRVGELLAGNPLALEEFAAGLDRAQALGTAPLPEIPILGGRGRLDFGAPILQLPERTRQALLVVVAAGRQQALVPPALRDLGLDTADLDPAIDAGLLVENDGLQFTHPLRRAAAYQVVPAGDRRRVHATLAGLCAGLDSVRHAYHLDASGQTGESAAAAMEEAARSIALRAGPGAAAQAWARAADLSLERRPRDRRLIRAAEAFFLGGDRAQASLRLGELVGPNQLDAEALDARAAHLEPEVLAEALSLQCAMAIWHETDRAEIARLAGALNWLARLDRRRALVACSGLSAAAENLGLLHLAEQLTERGVQLSATLEEALRLEARYSALHVGVLTKGGGAVQPIREVASLEVIAAILDRSPTGLWGVAQAACWQEDFAFAWAVSLRAVDSLRNRSALAWLPYALTVQADLWWWFGDWDRASAGMSEGLELIRLTDQDSLLGYALAMKARILGPQGRHDACRAAGLEALRLVTTGREEPVVLYARHSLGLSDLGAGRPGSAVEHLQVADDYAQSVGLAQPSVVPYLADYVEALIETGDVDRAHAVTLRFEHLTGTSGSDWARGASGRVKAMLDADDDRAIEQLRQSVSTFTTVRPVPFERARSLLTLGSRLRRGRKPSEARGVLREASETFAACGAPDWTARADAERRAAGDRTTQVRPASGLADLTSQQQQVVLMVAGGATNKQVGANLFLSPKTVEYHLRRACAQLGVRNRVELSRYVARADPGDPH